MYEPPPTLAQRNEQDRALVLDKRDLPDLLIQAVDRIPSGWTALSAQLELFRLGDPEVIRELVATRRVPRTGLNPDRVEITLARGIIDDLERLGLSVSFTNRRNQGFVSLPSRPSGGYKRSLLRALVEEMVIEMLPEGASVSEEVRRGNRSKRREWFERISEVLRDLFPHDRTSTDSRGLLKRTFDNALHSLAEEERGT